MSTTAAVAEAPREVVSAAETAADHGDWTPSYNPYLIAMAVMLATFIEVLDTSVANVALPQIAGNLSVTTDEATWVLTSYLVSNAIILPATAWLGNLFGRKRFLVGCIILFTVASVLSGAATSLGMLVAARILQGIGGGALQPIAQSVLMESFPPQKRGQAMALYGMGVVVAPVIGPALGGWITDNYSWRWIFFINIPFGILAGVLTQAFVEDPPYLKRGVERIDYVGFGFMTLWLATLQIVLDRGQQDDWFNARWVVWFSAISAVSMLIFIVWELWTEHPIVDLHVFRDRNFATATSVMTLLGVVLYGSTVLLPLFLQTLMQYPAYNSGLALSPRGMGAFVSMVMMARLVGAIDNRVLIGTGCAMLTGSFYMMGNINLEITSWQVVLPNIINGLAMGFIFVPLTANSTATLPREEIGNASGIYNLTRNLGGSFGISIVTTILARASQRHQAELAGHMSVYNPIFTDAYARIHGGLSAVSGSVDAQPQALGLLYGILQQQAALTAYVYSFHAMAIIAALTLPLVLLMRKAKQQPGAEVMMH